MTSTAANLVADARRQITEIDPAPGLDLTGWRVIDVREPAEFATGHVPGAINIPRGILEFEVDKHVRSDGRADGIVVYCRSGARAALAAQTLQQLGFSAVHSIAGGIMGWAAAGGAVVMPADPPLIP